VPAVAGIKFIKDAKKNNRYVTIDLKKHSEAIMPVLKQLGAVKEEDDDFEKEWKKGISGDEFWSKINEKISNHYKNK
jgi:hypothetical protein